MTVELRHCPDCGVQREFARLHAGQARCPDGADGQCPEWVCLTCGAGLLADLVPLGAVRNGAGPGGDGAPLGRVA